MYYVSIYVDYVTMSTYFPPPLVIYEAVGVRVTL